MGVKVLTKGEVFFFGLAVDDGDWDALGTPKYERLGLAIANELMKRMNWIGLGE